MTVQDWSFLRRGEVSVTSNGESRPLAPGNFIYEHDEITVSNRSFAVLQFVDGAKVTLRPDSLLIIEQYSAEAATLNLGFRQFSGGSRVNCQVPV